MIEGVEAWSCRLMDLHEAFFVLKALFKTRLLFLKKVDLASLVSAAHETQIGFGAVGLGRALRESPVPGPAGIAAGEEQEAGVKSRRLG